MNIVVLEGRRQNMDLVPLETSEPDIRARKAIRGSKRLRDAIWKLQGFTPPKRLLAKHCAACLAPITTRRQLISEIQHTVASFYDMDPGVMTSAIRRRNIAHARQRAMYLASILTKHSIAEIGRRFNRDHTTVLHAIDAVKTRCETDEEEAFDISLLRERLAA